MTGMAGMIYMSRAIGLVKKYGAVVVTPEYRLSGEAPYPAALEDCYASLKYLKEHAAARFEQKYLEACGKYYAVQFKR